MAQTKPKIEAKNELWSSKRRYKIGDVVEHQGVLHVNVTGANGEPGVSSDWIEKNKIPDEIIKTTPQILTEAQQTQVLENQGINDLFYIKSKSNIQNPLPISLNKKWNISDNIDLDESSVDLPESISINGGLGKILNGTVNGSENKIFDTQRQIFGTDVTLTGRFDIDFVRPEWFGAKGDGVTDDTDAFKKAILLAKQRTSPEGKSGWGQNGILLSQKDYRVTDTIASGNSFLGFKFKGISQHGSQITFDSDSGVLFDFGAHANVTFEDLSIYHKPTLDSWSNVCFQLSGAGGGRRFSLVNCTLYNFDVQIKHTTDTNLNNDTNLFFGCSFYSCKTFLYSRNTQAVVNQFTLCTWAGQIEKCFDLAGFGHTKIDSGNVVISGTFLHFANAASKYGDSSVYDLNNVKFEPLANSDGDVLTRIIDADGSFVELIINLNNCGISSAVTPDAASRQFYIGAGIKLNINGGSYQNSKVETIGKTTLLKDNSSYIIFKGCRRVPNPSEIYRSGINSGLGHPSISYIDCNNYDNITFTKRTSYVANANHRTLICRDNVADGRISSGGVVNDVQIKFHGQETLVNEVIAVFNNDFGDTGDKTIEVYSDEARTNLIETLVVTGSATGATGKFTLSNEIYTEGLFFTVENDTDTAFGHIIVDYTNF